MLEKIKKYIPNPIKEILISFINNNPIELYRDRTSINNYKRLSAKKNGSIINVGFLVQMPEVWDKQKGLYEDLLKNDLFKVFLFVVPEYDFKNQKVKTTYDDNYFIMTYDESIKLYQNHKWLDIKSFKLDYLFYQRPYNTYLPRKYRSNVLGKKMKCCYVPYAFWPLKENLCGYNKSFFRYIYYAFMESKENIEIIKRMDVNPDKYIYCGYPVLDGVETVSAINTNSILWTPRWSSDSRIGGSHFLEYKDKIIDFANNNKKIEITIRPHPLAFDNYIRSGLMTEGEVDNYKKKVVNSGCLFDKNKNIEDTFKDTGVLITDVSSIVYPFFLSGKPIIFCNTDVPLSPSFIELMDGMYVANEWEDVIRYYSEIKQGNDYLKEKRIGIVSKIKEQHKNATKNIIKVLIKGN